MAGFSLGFPSCVLSTSYMRKVDCDDDIDFKNENAERKLDYNDNIDSHDEIAERKMDYDAEREIYYDELGEIDYERERKMDYDDYKDFEDEHEKRTYDDDLNFEMEMDYDAESEIYYDEQRKIDYERERKMDYDDYMDFEDEHEERFYDDDMNFEREMDYDAEREIYYDEQRKIDYERERKMDYDDYMDFKDEHEERFYDDDMTFEDGDKGFYEDDIDFEDELEERLEHETAILALLRGQNLVVYNSDGTLRCPLSPSRKKQAYSYKDLLQHATAVASGKRGPEAAGKHSTLETFLEPNLLSSSTRPLERLIKVEQNLPPRRLSLSTHSLKRLLKVEQNLPPRRQVEDMLVCPWSVVIYNIDNSTVDLTKPETWVRLGKSELKLYFADFNPLQIELCQFSPEHSGACVLQFGRDLSGLKDAQALEKSFIDHKHGYRDYERRLGSWDVSKEFYGWLAREDDYNDGLLCEQRGEEIGRYLRKVGNLKDIEMVGEELKRMHDQQVRQLVATVSENSKESEDLKTEVEINRRRAEAERLQLEKSHKLELEAVRVKARVLEEAYNELEKKLAELQSTQEYQEETITILTVKERESNDELVDGREMAVQVIQQYINEAKRLIEAALKKKDQLDKTKQPQPRVEVKRAGAIDDTAWSRAFKRKHKNAADWGIKMTEVFSRWEARIRNPEFQPYKTVQIGEDKWEQQIDDENGELASLKKTYGKEVYMSITTALMEIEEYNASGRYPVPVAWNFKKSRKASLKEVIQYLGRIIDSLVTPEVFAYLGRTIESLMAPGTPRKRSRN